MTTDGKIKDRKMLYDINRGAAQIKALASDKIDKCKW